jgi:dTDP-4-dehydrorhamnose 3,5-epimerase
VTSHGEIEGVKYFSNDKALDHRGYFKKLFNSEWNGAELFPTAEVFVSNSLPGVIRGMHLQVGESANQRLISVVSGQVFDVLIDLRSSSSTFLKLQCKILDSDSDAMVFVPSGVAHGFQAISESTMLYLSSSVYNPEHDKGINVNSLAINWPLKNHIVSERDSNLTPLNVWLHESLQ